MTSIIMTGGGLVTNDGAVYHSVPIILSHIKPKAALVQHLVRQCGPANHGLQHPHCAHYLHKSAPHACIGTSSKYFSDTLIALYEQCKLSSELIYAVQVDIFKALTCYVFHELPPSLHLTPMFSVMSPNTPRPPPI